MLDISRVRTMISHHIAECIHLKSVLRVAWARPMGEEQRRLVRVRRELTELFILLAFSRNKLHVRTAPRELASGSGPWDAAAYHRQVAMRLLPEYSLTDETSAVCS